MPDQSIQKLIEVLHEINANQQQQLKKQDQVLALQRENLELAKRQFQRAEKLQERAEKLQHTSPEWCRRRVRQWWLSYP